MESNSYKTLLNDSLLLNIKLVLEQSKDTLEECHKNYNNNAFYDDDNNPSIGDIHVLLTVLTNTLSTTQSELIDLIQEMLNMKKVIRSILDLR